MAGRKPLPAGTHDDEHSHEADGDGQPAMDADALLQHEAGQGRHQEGAAEGDRHRVGQREMAEGGVEAHESDEAARRPEGMPAGLAGAQRAQLAARGQEAR